MDEQQTATAAEPWYSAEVFFKLTPVDLLVLMCIGVGWSATIWLVVEGIKARLRWQKPYTRKQFYALSWLPVLTSGLLASYAFPLSLVGVGQPVDPSAAMAGCGFIVGVVGGLGAKLGHDVAGEILSAAFSRLIQLIGGNNARQ